VSAETSRHPSLDELSAWVDGEIGDGFDRQVLAEHVAACASCASLVEDFRALARAQEADPVPPVPFHLPGRVLDRLAGARSGSRPRRFLLPLSVAATLLVGVVAVWLYRQQQAPAEGTAALDTLETRQASPQAPQEQEAAPLAPAPAPAPATAIPPAPAETGKERQKEKSEKKVAKDAARSEPAFAPAPPQASSVMARQTSSVSETTPTRWMRLPPTPLAKARRDEAPSAAGAAAPAAPSEEAGAPCAVRDLLRPPLGWQGMDAEKAEALAERARSAGASDAIVARGPLPRLTLVLPVGAWPAVQDLLAESGIPIPDAVRAAPEGGGCLEVPIDAQP